LQALGQFDPTLNALITRNRDPRPLRQDEIAALNGLTPSAGFTTQVTNVTAYSVGVQQPLRSGVTLGATVDVTSVSDNVVQSGGVPPQTGGRIGFNLRAPLLRNARNHSNHGQSSAAGSRARGRAT
jgi:hypothetical protein